MDKNKREVLGDRLIWAGYVQSKRNDRPSEREREPEADGTNGEEED